MIFPTNYTKKLKKLLWFLFLPGKGKSNHPVASAAQSGTPSPQNFSLKLWLGQWGSMNFFNPKKIVYTHLDVDPTKHRFHIHLIFQQSTRFCQSKFDCIALELAQHQPTNIPTESFISKVKNSANLNCFQNKLHSSPNFEDFSYLLHKRNIGNQRNQFLENMVCLKKKMKNSEIGK